MHALKPACIPVGCFKARFGKKTMSLFVQEDTAEGSRDAFEKAKTAGRG